MLLGFSSFTRNLTFLDLSFLSILALSYYRRQEPWNFLLFYVLSVSSCCLSLRNAKIKFGTAAISLLLHLSLFVFLQQNWQKQCVNKTVLTYYATLSFWKNTNDKCQNLFLSFREMQLFFLSIFVLSIYSVHLSRFSPYWACHWINKMAM